MKDNEFCYWLKGAIQMNLSSSFDVDRTQTIKNNLNKVFETNSNPNSFCHFLQGYLTLVNPKELSKEIIQEIESKLNNFVQTIANIISESPMSEVERFNRQAIASGSSERAKC